MAVCRVGTLTDTSPSMNLAGLSISVTKWVVLESLSPVYFATSSLIHPSMQLLGAQLVCMTHDILGQEQGMILISNPLFAIIFCLTSTKAIFQKLYKMFSIRLFYITSKVEAEFRHITLYDTARSKSLIHNPKHKSNF